MEGGTTGNVGWGLGSAVRVLPPPGWGVSGLSLQQGHAAVPSSVPERSLCSQQTLIQRGRRVVGSESRQKRRLLS